MIDSGDDFDEVNRLFREKLVEFGVDVGVFKKLIRNPMSLILCKNNIMDFVNCIFFFDLRFGEKDDLLEKIFEFGLKHRCLELLKDVGFFYKRAEKYATQCLSEELCYVFNVFKFGHHYKKWQGLIASLDYKKMPFITSISIRDTEGFNDLTNLFDSAVNTVFLRYKNDTDHYERFILTDPKRKTTLIEVLKKNDLRDIESCIGCGVMYQLLRIFSIDQVHDRVFNYDIQLEFKAGKKCSILLAYHQVQYVLFPCDLEVRNTEFYQEKAKSVAGIYQKIESMKKEDFGDITIQLVKKPKDMIIF